MERSCRSQAPPSTRGAGGSRRLYSHGSHHRVWELPGSGGWEDGALITPPITHQTLLRRPIADDCSNWPQQTTR